MRMLLSALALLIGAHAAPPVSFADTQQAPTLAPGRQLHAFRCPHNLLRVVFDGDRNVVVIYRFGRPPVTLSRQQTAGADFHFSNATYDLEGTFEEVRFRVGQTEAARCPSNSAN